MLKVILILGLIILFVLVCADIIHDIKFLVDSYHKTMHKNDKKKEENEKNE